MIRRVPASASVAEQREGKRLFAPSAERNTEPLCEILHNVAPRRGKALEIASGTGQHVIAFATCLPELIWQPTEPDADRRASIDAYAAQENMPNLLPAQPLDAAKPGWGASRYGQSLIVVINLLHLISTMEAQNVITESAQALLPGGKLIVYGPFKRGGELTSEGDQKFHDSLVSMDAEIGYKDDYEILDTAIACGLAPAEIIEMPANNLTMVLEKPIV